MAASGIAPYIGSTTATTDLIASDQAFGTSVAISGDGQVMAAGMPVNSNSAGGYTIYRRSNSLYTPGWSRDSFINMGSPPFVSLGEAVALSDDGTTFIVGQSGSSGGALYPRCQVYKYASGTWTLEIDLFTSPASYTSSFGARIAMSGDGNTVAISAPTETYTSGSTYTTGAVYIFVRTFPFPGVTQWTQQQIIYPDFSVIAASSWNNTQFSDAISLSQDGNTLAVGARYVAVSGTESGRVQMFTRSGSVWSFQQMLASSNSGEAFGASVALSGDGSRLIIGAPHANPGNTGYQKGRVYYYYRYLTSWFLATGGSIIPSDGAISNRFGTATVMSYDGTIFATSAPQNVNDGYVRGAVYIFKYSPQPPTFSTPWIQTQKLIPFDSPYLNGASYSFISVLSIFQNLRMGVGVNTLAMARAAKTPLVVGAPQQDQLSLSNNGAILVYS